MQNLLTEDRNTIKQLCEKYRNNAYTMYVEYPHKSFWPEEFKDKDYRSALKTLFSYRKDLPIAFYVHIPFCPRQCYFCSCYNIVTRDYEMIKKYLYYLFREIYMLRDFFYKNGITPNFKELHIGGGSPTYLKENDFDALIENIKTIVNFKELREVTIEIDPRVTTKERLYYYHAKGINRISLGVQDFDYEIQKAVNRIQPRESIERLLTTDIRKYFTSVNFDILCGLPLQTQQTFRKTMETLIELSPDRTCLIYLTYVPEVRKHQLYMNRYRLPTHYEKLMLLQEGVDCLLENGYERIGLDHFAKSEDSLAEAKRRNDLHWNGLGYRAGEFLDIIGVGASSASRITPYYYSQNYYELPYYEDALDEGHLPIYRGYKLGEDEVIRRDIIHRLRTYFYVDCSEISEKYKIDFKTYFQEEHVLLSEFEQDGMLNFSKDKIAVTDLGIHFTYLICRIFDKLNRIQKG